MNDERGSVCTAGELNEYRLRPTAFGGHCFYVRRCLPGDAADRQDPKVCSIGGIVIPPSMGNQTVWFECRAVGPRVGTPCSETHAKKYRAAIAKKHGMGAARLPRDIPADLVGKRLFVALPWPLVDERVMPSPLADFESFIEESLPEAYMIEDEQ